MVIPESEHKSERITNILGEVLYLSCFSKPLFLQPSLFGLISNNEIEKLKHVLKEFSKFVEIIMSGGKIHGALKKTWIYHFKDYISEKHKARNNFINNLISYEIPGNNND